MLETLEKNGVGLVEVGFPFSDPIADGPVIQAANAAAIRGGMTLEKLFTLLEPLRKSVSIPVVLMGSFNPVLRFGVERFLERCKDVGVDGVLLPDLPPEVYRRDYQKLFEEHGVTPVFLVTPESSDSRIRELADLSKGFLYLVSQSATTGADLRVSDQLAAYVGRVRTACGRKLPLVLGFGIKNAASFDAACAHADGAVVGTAFVSALEGGDGDVYQRAGSFVRSLLEGRDDN